MAVAATTRFLLVRHAEVERRYQHVFGGRVDMALSPRGRRQATALARYLQSKPFEALFASPMKRVQQTLAPVRRDGIPNPIVLDDLREVDFGDWTGLGWEAVRARFGVEAFTWLQQLQRGSIPNAEDVHQYRRRIERCLRRMLAGNAGRTIAVFCHGGVIRMMLAILLRLPFPRTDAFQIEYASLTEVSVGPERTRIELLNFTPWRDGRP
jgi:broad specificity phosphatase PhoE